MKKLVVISNCYECPHSQDYCADGVYFYVCTKVKKDLEPNSGIPDWCPLPDVGEKQNG